MQTRVLATLVAILIAMTLVQPGSGVAAPQRTPTPRPSPTPSPSRVACSGIVTQVQRTDSGLRLLVSEADGSTHTVLVGSATEITIITEVQGQRQETQGSMNDLAVGNRIRCSGNRLDSGAVQATQIAILRTQPGPIVTRSPEPRPSPTPVPTRTRPEVSRGLVAAGAVINDAGHTITVLQRNGSTVTVIGSQNVKVVGGRRSFEAISICDHVRVQGTMQRTGVVVARQVEVVFAASNPIAGTIVQVSRDDAEIILDNGIVVRVNEQTLILGNGQVRSIRDLNRGMRVRVYGTAAGGRDEPRGINAMCIVF